MDLAKKWLSFRQAQTLQSSPDLGQHSTWSLDDIMPDTTAHAHGSSSGYFYVNSGLLAFSPAEQAEAPLMTFPVTPSQRREALLSREETESFEGERESYQGRDEGNGLQVALQPETRPITQDQLVTEVKVIHDGLSIMSNNCIELGSARMSVQEPTSKLNWKRQALIAVHRTLCRDFPGFFIEPQSIYTQSLRRLFNTRPWTKGPMIAILWAGYWAFCKFPPSPAYEGTPATPTSTPLLSPTAAIGDVLFTTIGGKSPSRHCDRSSI